MKIQIIFYWLFLNLIWFILLFFYILECPYVTTKCNFKGKRTEICDSENKINSNIKSVYVP